MARSSAPRDVTTAGDDDAFLVPAAVRQPAEGLGPRAKRTIEAILDAARTVFLGKGYAGTTIDEIAQLAGVSRASVYTYFPSKREVLFAIGSRGAVDHGAHLDSLLDRPPTVEGITGFASDYLDLLDVYGSFSFAWTQAARDDEEIRVTGRQRHLEMCRRFGEVIETWSGTPIDDHTLAGLTAWSMVERTWDFAELYGTTLEREAVIAMLARNLWAITRSEG